MAKCNICKDRKGKRKCQSTDIVVCSLCCGETRTSEKCDGCSYYKDPCSEKKYSKIPHYTIREMDGDFELQNIAELIEKGLCIIDDQHNIDDSLSIRFIELLLDKYFYKDETVSFNTHLEQEGFSFIHEHIENNFKDLPNDQIYKVLSTVLRSIKRHKNGTRGYLNFAHQFAGV